MTVGFALNKLLHRWLKYKYMKLETLVKKLSSYEVCTNVRRIFVSWDQPVSPGKCDLERFPDASGQIATFISLMSCYLYYEVN